MKKVWALVLLVTMASAAIAQEKALDTTNSSGLIFATGASSPTTERMRITQDGKIGVGKSPVAKLDVLGTISASDAIQVSGSTLTCNAGLKGAIRYSNTSSTLEFCEGSSWTGVSSSGSSGSSVAFDVRKTANQALTVGVTTKVTFDTVLYNQGSGYASNRFTAPVAGKYIFMSSIDCSYSAGNYCAVTFYRNGSPYAGSQGSAGAQYLGTNVVALIDLGINDYVEVFVTSGANPIRGIGQQVFFAGFLLAASPVGDGFPSGAVVGFDLTSCPYGWSEYTAARGRFLRGIDNGAGNDPAGTRAPGNTQTDAFQGHWHNFQWATTTATAGATSIITSQNIVPSANHVRDAISDGSNGVPRTANETRPKNVAVLYCRKD